MRAFYPRGSSGGGLAYFPSNLLARTRAEHLHGQVEIFLTRRMDGDIWEALVRPGRKLPVGERILFGEDELEAEILARGELGIRTLQFVSRTQQSVSETIQRVGTCSFATLHRPARRNLRS